MINIKKVGLHLKKKLDSLHFNELNSSIIDFVLKRYE